jgi:hypothetical protein
MTAAIAHANIDKTATPTTLKQGQAALIYPVLSQRWLTNPHRNDWCDARGNGVPCHSGPDGAYPLPDGSPEGCLVAWCGPNVAFMSADPTMAYFEITGPGQIQIGPNDNILGDNEGSIQVLITLSRASGQEGRVDAGLRIDAPLQPHYWQITFQHPNGPSTGYAYFNNPDVGKQSSRVPIPPNATPFECVDAVVNAATEASLPVSLEANNSVFVYTASVNARYDIVTPGVDPAVVVDSDARQARLRTHS